MRINQNYEHLKNGGDFFEDDIRREIQAHNFQKSFNTHHKDNESNHAKLKEHQQPHWKQD